MISIMSENDRLDHQLRHGTDYINLPEQSYPTDQAPTLIPQQETINDTQTKPRENRFLHHIRPATTGSQISQERYANHQQMDAQNRLQRLELIRPRENLTLLNIKFRTLQHPRHTRPTLPQYRDDYVNTLYDQTGRYVQERAGLYHTDSYEPSALAQAVPELQNEEENFPTSKDDENTPTHLLQSKAIGDYQNMRNRLLNKFHASHDASTVDSRTQEGDKQFVQCQSVYGLAYNTPKFLQENTLTPHARADPSRLMSTRYNYNLGRVRSLNSYPMQTIEHPAVNPKQEKVDPTLVSPVLYPPTQDQIYTTKSIAEQTDGYSRRSTARVYYSPFKSEYTNQVMTQSTPSQSNSFDPILCIPAPVPRSVKTAIHLPGPEIVARFIDPKLEPKTTYQRSYKDITYHEARPSQKHTTSRSARLSDDHFKQWKLADLQERWSKTQAQQQYHTEYPEVAPDTSGITLRARKEILVADAIAKKAMLTIR